MRLPGPFIWQEDRTENFMFWDAGLHVTCSADPYYGCAVHGFVRTA